jgi:hypothetical protein
MPIGSVDIPNRRSGTVPPYEAFTVSNRGSTSAKARIVADMVGDSMGCNAVSTGF